MILGASPLGSLPLGGTDDSSSSNPGDAALAQTLGALLSIATATFEINAGITLADIEWPFDDLKPRHIGIYPVAAPIGGGIALTGKEPVIDSGAGFWRIALGGIPVKTRANI